MSRIPVLVATASGDMGDMLAKFICREAIQRADMDLIAGRPVGTDEIGPILESLPTDGQYALVVVGHPSQTERIAAYWVSQRKDLVFLGVDIVGDRVRLEVSDPGLGSLLAALRELADRTGASPQDRISWLRLPRPSSGQTKAGQLSDRPLLDAAVDWVHALLRAAAARHFDHKHDLATGTTTTEVMTAAIADFRDKRGPFSELIADFKVNDTALSKALQDADPANEPLAQLSMSLELSPREFRVVVLSLAPELDARHQRWIGFLMDDLTRRTGTLALFSELLGVPSQVRRELAASARLGSWRLLEGGTPHADEPLRLDPSIRGWLLGDDRALVADPHLTPLLRPSPWGGASLVQADRDRAVKLVEAIGADAVQWRLLIGRHPANWRALIELGATALQLSPIRADLAGLGSLDAGQAEEIGIRLARLSKLTGNPLVLDASQDGSGALPGLLHAINRAHCPAAILTADLTGILRSVGPDRYAIEADDLTVRSRTAAFLSAAAGAGVTLSRDAAESIAARYPLHVDNLEYASFLARNAPPSLVENRQDHFLAACKQAAAEGTSNLAQRIEPPFKLDEVVLSPDRKRQLEEIVSNVQLSSKVLDGWNFRVQLPYGRGVTALFHGPSGTGKTMAALAVAQKLGVHVLRVDLSRVVSKFIGDTEKHVDAVFRDAELSGAALLIDEAEALLGKRSEINDAHDRYANIEVAYLLQRMEAFEGLAILTTNLRQNVDAAFLRRLRFIIDFPRPDAVAREEIWRRCLPEGSHSLDESAFHQLARRIELTGGHVRQITLRAAFIAAAADVRIGLEHIAQATQAELAKLGLPPVELEIFGKRRAA